MSAGTERYRCRSYGKVFSDSIGLLRYQLWLAGINPQSTENLDRAKIPPDVFKRMAEAFCYAA